MTLRCKLKTLKGQKNGKFKVVLICPRGKNVTKKDYKRSLKETSIQVQ